MVNPKDVDPSQLPSFIPSDPESEELREYMDELWKRLPEHARRAASVKPDAHRSVEWYASVGKFFRQEREGAGLNRYEVAKKMGVPVNVIRFLEVGIPTDEELSSDFVLKYARAIGKPGLWASFENHFRNKPDPTKTHY